MSHTTRRVAPEHAPLRLADLVLDDAPRALAMREVSLVLVNEANQVPALVIGRDRSRPATADLIRLEMHPSILWTTAGNARVIAQTLLAYADRLDAENTPPSDRALN
jgi:hypothetical protein